MHDLEKRFLAHAESERDALVRKRQECVEILESIIPKIQRLNRLINSIKGITPPVAKRASDLVLEQIRNKGKQTISHISSDTGLTYGVVRYHLLKAEKAGLVRSSEAVVGGKVTKLWRIASCEPTQSKQSSESQ